MEWEWDVSTGRGSLFFSWDVSLQAEEEVQKVLMEVAGDVLEKLPGGVPRSQKEAMTKEEAEVAAAAKLLGAEA